jgi:pimeloyl-ACP methyl ester carboxylesterase
MEHLIVEGTGRTILVLHGGMGDLSSWKEVTDRLRDRFRVARLYRRQYRLDIPRRVSMAEEAAEVLAAAATLDRPMLVGHSSGAVLALEALVASPNLFSAAVLYEPPLRLDRPLGDGTQWDDRGDRSPHADADPGSADAQPGSVRSERPSERPIDRARTALAEGRPGTAFAIFVGEIAGIGGDMVAAAEAALNQRPEIGPVVERQLDDNDEIDELGNRLAAYAGINLPVLLLTGDQSPRHLRGRLAALQHVLPDARRVTLRGESHNAERSAPDRLAEVIAAFAEGAVTVRTPPPTS